MAKQKGRLMLVKIGSGGGSETFATLCGLTTKSLKINNTEIDVTTADCAAPGGPLWTEVLDGTRRLSVSGNGFFEDSAAEARLLALSQADTPIGNFQVIVPALGLWQGPFFLSEVDYGGEQEGGLTYSLSMASTGPVAFTAAAP